MNKKGLSPVIATVLLILLALVLIGLLFVWFKSFIGETIQKKGEDVKNFCPEVQFKADGKIENNILKLSVQNDGNVPLYGVEVKRKGVGSLSKVGSTEGTIGKGETSPVQIAGVSETGEYILAPIILGEIGTAKHPYTCPDINGIVIQV